MHLVKTTKPGTCDAKRCKRASAYILPGADLGHPERDAVHLCVEHTPDDAPGAVTIAKDVDENRPVPTEENANARAIALAEAEKTEAETALVYARDVEIEGQADLEFVGEILRDVKGRAKRLDAAEKEITKPLNDALKAARDLFRTPKKLLAEIEKELKAKIAGFATSAAEHNRKALADAAAAATPEEANAAIARIANVADVEGVSLVTRWKYEITDADAIPREYLTPDAGKLADAARAFGKSEGAEIPGVRFFPDTGVSAKSA